MQQLSTDGAMAPLVHGEWTAVRTIVLGEIEPGGEKETVKATNLRAFSRLCSAADFIDWAALPLHQAGTTRAGTVVAVQDGTEWLQELVEAHCPDAIRILDFPYAAEYLVKLPAGAGERSAAAAPRGTSGGTTQAGATDRHSGGLAREGPARGVTQDGRRSSHRASPLASGHDQRLAQLDAAGA